MDWRDNIDLSNEIEITKILKILNIDNKKFFEGISNQLIKDQLKELTAEAFKKELFGAPNFVANTPEFRELFGERMAKSLAVYKHNHDHEHQIDGSIKK